MKPITDNRLVEKTLAGDTRAFAILIDRHQGFVFTIIYRVVKGREEAEEIAQDVFLKAYDALGSFRKESKFTTWLYKIAYHKALDKVRGSKQNVLLELDENLQAPQVQYLEDGLSLMLREERSQLIKNCIEKLPPQEAALISLYYFEEQSIKEIKEVTGLTKDNIKIKLYRSRKILFSLLEKQIKTT